jgi:protease II
VSASYAVEPQAEQRPLERAIHGIRLIDEYAWLKAENWQQVMRDASQLDPEIRAYLEAENDYSELSRLFYGQVGWLRALENSDDSAAARA